MILQDFDYETMPTVSIVKKILTDAIKYEATDIHFDPADDGLIIKFRINGELKEYALTPLNVKPNIITRIKILAGMKITDSTLPQTGNINFEINNKQHSMRTSSLPVAEGEKIVVHISDYASNIKNLQGLNFTKDNTLKVENFLKEKQGIILITGNDNSGKTTTTYSLLKELNTKNNSIISLENPIKMKIKGINQVQIAPDKGLSYRNILKTIALQDPNVIAINELVDDEVTRASIRSALSGRLVISTMHTKTIYQTIETLLNMDVENYLLGANLIGIISERLVKRLCPHCRKKHAVTAYEAQVLKSILGTEVNELYYPHGCIECNDGYLEQIPIEEVIEIDEELRLAISNNKNHDLIKNIVNEKTDSLIKNGFKKVVEGLTSFEEIIRVLDLRVDLLNNKEAKDIILGNTNTNSSSSDPSSPLLSQKENTPNLNLPVNDQNIDKKDEDTKKPEDKAQVALEPKEDSPKKDEPNAEKKDANSDVFKNYNTLLNNLRNLENPAFKKPESSPSKETELEKTDSSKSEETDTTNKKETPSAKDNSSNSTTSPYEYETKKENNDTSSTYTNDNNDKEAHDVSSDKQETKEDDKQDKTDNITNLSISANELDNMLSKIDNASSKSIEKTSTSSSNEPKEETSTHIEPPLNIEDDDDDDFNYGASYINHF